MKKVAVVGGGMAGLAAAYYLDRGARESGKALEVSLFEASDRLGGKVRSLSDGPYRLEGGPDAVVRYKPWFLQLVRELGLEDRIVGTQPAKPAALIHKGGRGHPLPEGLNVVIPSRFGPLLTTPLLSPIGKLRAGLDLFLPRGPEGDEPFGAFIERRLGREVWRNLAAPLTGGIYGGDPYELSTLAAFPMLKELERQHRSLVLGSLATMRRRKGSREGGGLFASLSGGLGEVALAVQKQATGAHWRMRSPVERADREEQGWYLFGPWGTERFDAVVFATPAPAAATALEPLDRELARTLRSIPYGSAATVTFALEEEAVPPLKGHGVLIAAGEGFAARGFTWLSRKWANRAPAGKLLVRAYFSGEPADLDEDALIEAARDDLKRLLAFEPQPLKTWAFRWPRGMPQYTVGHLERIRALEEASKRWPGLELIGAAYRGVGLPEVVRDGRQAAERLLASLT